VNGADPTGSKPSGALGNFVVDVARPEHRPLLITPDAISDTIFNSALAVP
jgi:hypothetical protein